jgi:hypothetical protein
MSTHGSSPQRIHQRTYVATDLASGLQIGYDRLRRVETGNGLRLESSHTAFGTPGAVQRVEFHLDRDWIPRRLLARSQAWHSLTVEFGESETRLRVRRGPEARQMVLPVGRREALLLLSGGFSFPVHAVHRFLMSERRPVRFQLIPEGTCTVEGGPEGPWSADGFRMLEMRLAASGVEDRLALLVDSAGELVRFHARNRNLLVRLEGSGSPC